jgi:threonyl-tRNA synthetase
VRFVPQANWSGAVAGGLSFRAWDASSGTAGGVADTTLNGGTSAFSTATASAGITVGAVNDAPSGADRTLGLLEDTSHVFTAADFGFSEVIYRLSTRPPKRVGSDEAWDKAEKALADALDAKQLPWEELPGEGAFYGPKIEFSLKDCIGRVWQCGTMQVDFSMPGRLDASYIDERGERQVPVMLHRAILGSFERFIGILIENFEGRLPLWLAPVQAVVMNITDKQAQFVEEVLEVLQNRGLRVQTDVRNEKIGFKIREWTLQRVPYLLVVGDREVENRSIAVRTRDGEDLGVLTLEELNLMLVTEVADRGRAVNTAAQEG